MEINRQNYEMYILDYIEGQLPENMVLAMLTFLKNNPEIEVEANALMENAFVAENIKFSDKESLKKNPEHDIPGISKFEQLSIAYLENDILPLELENLNKILEQDKAKSTEHLLLNKTKLQPDFSIVFPDKKQLKQLHGTFRLTKKLIYYAVAAGIALILGFGFLFRQNNHLEYGKTIAFNNHDFKNRQLAEIQVVINQIIDKQIASIKIGENPDTVILLEKFEIETLNSKQLALLELPLKNNQLLFSRIGETKSQNFKSGDEDFMSIQAFISQRFKEKILRQDENDKVTLISVVNAFGRFTKKVFNKKLEVEKSKTENGASLYAIKTDSYNLYTLRNARKKENTKDSN